VSTARALWARDRLAFLLAAIAAATIVSGLVQLVAPGFVLGILDADSTATTRHFFAIVGMFMAIVGALLLHTLLRPPPADRVVVMWASLQKLGACLAVAIGVGHDIFSSLALLVAAFDFCTAAIGGLFLWRERRRS
jgi:hypothetical protein